MLKEQISNNTVGAPAGSEKNCNSGTAAQTIPETMAQSIVVCPDVSNRVPYVFVLKLPGLL
jgi:hypothetical protein